MIDYTNQYEFNVTINGRPVTEYSHNGHVYIEGRKGSEYKLRISNRSNERILAVPAVDGLSVFDGKPASHESSGYIINNGSSIDVAGWTLNSNEVAKFEFADTKDSYSKRSGNGTSNVGVVGVMIFREKIVRNLISTHATRRVDPNYHVYDDYSGQYLPTASASMASSVGTAFGEVETFNTVSSSFEKRDPNYPDAMMVLYYDSMKGLERRGIVVKSYNPDPFPKYSTGCTPPPNWKR